MSTLSVTTEGPLFSAVVLSVIVTVALSSLMIVTVAVSVIVISVGLLELLIRTLNCSSSSSLLSAVNEILTVLLSPALPEKVTVCAPPLSAVKSESPVVAVPLSVKTSNVKPP